MRKLIPISHAGIRVADLTGKSIPRPRVIWELALAARFPAEFIRGRWFVDEADIPKVAAALGIDVPPVHAEAA